MLELGFEPQSSGSPAWAHKLFHTNQEKEYETHSTQKRKYKYYLSNTRIIFHISVLMYKLKQQGIIFAYKLEKIFKYYNYTGNAGARLLKLDSGGFSEKYAGSTQKSTQESQ